MIPHSSPFQLRWSTPFAKFNLRQALKKTRTNIFFQFTICFWKYHWILFLWDVLSWGWNFTKSTPSSMSCGRPQRRQGVCRKRPLPVVGVSGGENKPGPPLTFVFYTAVAGGASWATHGATTTFRSLSRCGLKTHTQNSATAEHGHQRYCYASV